jgi:hypothetical protein
LINVSRRFPNGENGIDVASHLDICSRLVNVMNTGARTFLLLTVLLSSVAGPSVQDVAAGTVSVSYSGKIVSVSSAATTATGVVVGDTITGSFVFDSTQSGSATTGLFTFTDSAKIHNFSLKIFNPSGTQQFSDSFTGRNAPPADYYAIQLAFSSTSGTTFRLMGDTVYKQGLGVTHSGGGVAYDLKISNPTNAGGYSATNLPLPNTTTIANFSKTTAELHWDPDGQEFISIITSLKLQSVPEPSSLALAIVALATCTGGFLWRRSRLRTAA